MSRHPLSSPASALPSALCFAFVLLMAAPAWAQSPVKVAPAAPTEAPSPPLAPPADALTPEQHYEQALQRFEAREWEEAATHFEAALRQDPNAILAFNAGRSHEYTGDLEAAERFYIQALELRPDPELRQRLYTTLERVTNLRERLGALAAERDSFGVLEVTTDPPGAVVRLNGEVAGVTPLQAAHPVGSYTVVAELEGYSALRRDVEIKPGRDMILTATLEEQGRLWTWITGGVGVALIGGGIGLGLAAQQTLDELDSPTGKRMSAEDFEALQSTGELQAYSSILLYTVGGLSLASSVLLYFIEAPPEETSGSETPSAGALRLDVGLGQVGISGTF